MMITNNVTESLVENPYILRPFENARNFFGRTREVEELYNLLIAERIVILHSPSGAGKTSFIQAGLIPRLNDRFDVWGPTRVNLALLANSSVPVNHYAYSAVLGFEQQIPAERRRIEPQLAKMTLAEYVANRPRRHSAPRRIMLIFDQFEDILSLDQFGTEAKYEFFEQLGETLLNPSIWALFAMREDYLPALESYSDQVPTHLKTRFRLDFLRDGEAVEGIIEAAKAGGRQFDSDAAKTLVESMTLVKQQQPDGTVLEKKSPYVEPFQLQLVCHRLWERIPKDKQIIRQAEVEELGNVSNVLADYYATIVARLADGDIRIERKLREWVGDQLITPNGTRSQVLCGVSQSGGLGNKFITNLVNAYLVRIEQYKGATWYELAHDRLIDPIRNNNSGWLDAHLNKIQKLASLWEREGHPDGLLLRGEDLIEANNWAEQNKDSITVAESEFLGASARKQKIIQYEREHMKWSRFLQIALAVETILVVILATIILKNCMQ